jgi:hypothetical protein
MDGVGIGEPKTALRAKTHAVVACAVGSPIPIRRQSELLFLALLVETAFREHSNLGPFYWLTRASVCDDELDFEVGVTNPTKSLAPVKSKDTEGNSCHTGKTNPERSSHRRLRSVVPRRTIIGNAPPLND